MHLEVDGEREAVGEEFVVGPESKFNLPFKTKKGAVCARSYINSHKQLQFEPKWGVGISPGHSAFKKRSQCFFPYLCCFWLIWSAKFLKSYLCPLCVALSVFYLTGMINGAVWVWPHEIQFKGYFNRCKKKMFHNSFQLNTVSLPSSLAPCSQESISDVGPESLCARLSTLV